jgi:anti-sigma regulatory factor (Ser/Thr protein kinase)
MMSGSRPSHTRLTERAPRSLTIDSVTFLLPTEDALPAVHSLDASALEDIDAAGAASLRARVELLAGYREQLVDITVPRLTTTWRMLHDLFEAQPPDNLSLPDPDPAISPIGEWPGSTVLASRVVRSLEEAAHVAETLLAYAAHEPSISRQLVQLAGAVVELAANALTHGRSSPTGAAICAMHHGPTNTVQVAVVDLAPPRANLASSISERADSYLNSQAKFWDHVGLNPQITLTSGAERLFWNHGHWTSTAAAEEVQGFIAFVALPAQRSF